MVVLQRYCKHFSVLYLSLEQESSEDTEEVHEEDKVDQEDHENQVRPCSLSPEELEKLKEAVEERKKLIQSLRGKPWSMKKKLLTLRYFMVTITNWSRFVKIE